MIKKAKEKEVKKKKAAVKTAKVLPKPAKPRRGAKKAAAIKLKVVKKRVKAAEPKKEEAPVIKRAEPAAAKKREETKIKPAAAAAAEKPIIKKTLPVKEEVKIAKVAKVETKPFGQSSGLSPEPPVVSEAEPSRGTAKARRR